MSKITKIINFEIKQVGEESDRVLRFIGSDETPDRDSDIIEVNGWMCENYLKNPVFLWAHNYSIPPIGKCVNLNKNLNTKCMEFDIKFPTISELSSDVENPAEHAKFVDMIYNMYKGGYLKATSVGFMGKKYKTRDDDAVLDKPEWQRGRRYMEQELLELSGVPVPSNPNALETAKAKGLIDDTIIKAFEIKKPDTEGNPSIYDIMRAIREVVNPGYVMHDVWVEDLYPKSYPNGAVIISKEGKYFMYDYTFENGVAVLSNPIEVEDVYREKPKSIKSLYEEKAGATISAKNRQTIMTACNQISKVAEMLEEMIHVDEEGDDEKIVIPDSQKVIDTLTAFIEKKFDEIKVKAPDPVSTEVHINLDEIQLLDDKTKVANKEPEFKPEQLSEMVSKALTETINRLTGKITI